MNKSIAITVIVIGLLGGLSLFILGKEELGVIFVSVAWALYEKIGKSNVVQENKDLMESNKALKEYNSDLKFKINSAKNLRKE